MKKNSQDPGHNSKVTNEENMTQPQEKKSAETNPQYDSYVGISKL